MRHRNGKKEKDDEIRLIYDNVPGHWKWPKKKKKERGMLPCFWLLTIRVHF